MLALAGAAAVSYLLGSIPAGYIAGWLGGIDIRRAGSGNIGATNVTRVLGKQYGYPVFVFDFLKGLLAVFFAIQLYHHVQAKSESAEIYGIVGAVFSVVGHMFPVWLGLKGGKGVATSAGALFGLAPLAALIGVVVWVLIFKMTRYVSLASVTAAVILPFAVLGLTYVRHAAGMEVFYFCICLAAIVVFRHRSNLSRLLLGTEPRFKGK